MSQALKENWGYKEIKPCLQWLLESARERKDVVDLCGVIFPGDFDLKSVCSPSDLPHGVIFHKAIFNGTADFREFEFKDANDFGKVRFNSDALFNAATFRCVADFQDAVFGGGADFGKTQFHQHANFGKARFTGNAVFTEARFPNGFDFKKAIFDNEVNFQGVHSSGDAIFQSTRFGGSALFQSANLAQLPAAGVASDRPSVDFSNARFVVDVSFRGMTFAGVAMFDSVKFGGSADFFRARFDKATLFSGNVEFGSVSFFNDATFFDVAYFEEVRFVGPASFEESSFNSESRFQEARFNDLASFQNATFSGESLFQGAQFDGFANFEMASFRRQSRFQGVRFGDNVNFIDTKFDGDTEFDGAQFCGDADIHGSESEGIHAASFAGARFGKSARFANRKFLDKTSFSHATFCRAPDFHNATLHQDTDFSGAKFKQRKGGDAARAYRTLKLAMELWRARREEGMFHALEQRSLLFSRETTPPEKIVSFLYWVSANYGQAVWRPFLWLIGLQVIFAGLYLAVFPELAGPSFGQAFQFALQQIFLPFYVFRQTVGSGAPYSLWLLLIMALQSLATYGLLALFLLALRRRFRMA